MRTLWNIPWVKKTAWTGALLAAPLGAPAPAQPSPSDRETSRTLALDLVLREAGLERSRLSPDPIQYAMRSRGDELPLLRGFLADPLGASYRTGMIERRFRDFADSPHRLFLQTQSLLSVDMARGYHGNPMADLDQRLAAAEDPLDAALRMLADATEPFEITAQLPTWQTLPNPDRHEYARVIAAISRAVQFRERAFRKVPKDFDSNRLFEQIVRGRFDLADSEDYRLYIRDIELEALFAGMLELLMAMEDLDHFLSGHPPAPLALRIETPEGTIVIDTTGADNEHSAEAPLLFIDVGGNDRYFEHDARTARSGISIVYDRGGNDWHWQEPGRGASALFGYGITWDTEGDDRYASDYLGQSAALFGATVHYDGGGNDVYTATAYSQAFAIGGAALLADLGGDDSFDSVIRSQASAMPRGAAVLFKHGGNDVYTLRNEPLLSPSAQSPAHNTSMGQGAATGFRADLNDGRSLAGGVAMLVDTGGDDVYTAGVFAQGAGFLEGTGILVDGGGSDRYEGVWYVQGAAAHRAAGILLDRGDGDDTHTALLYSSLAMGHDFSLGLLINEAGNNVYTLKSLGLGAGNDNGIGIFADGGGDDVYTLEGGESYGLGGARLSLWGTSREISPGVGLFLDLGGNDRYERKNDPPQNNSTWRWPRRFPEFMLPSEAGAGIDGEYEMPFLLEPRTPADKSERESFQRTLGDRRSYRASIRETPDGQSVPPEPPQRPQ